MTIFKVTDGNVAVSLRDEDTLHLVLVEVEEPPQELHVLAEQVDLMEEARVVELKHEIQALADGRKIPRPVQRPVAARLVPLGLRSESWVQSHEVAKILRYDWKSTGQGRIRLSFQNRG